MSQMKDCGASVLKEPAWQCVDETSCPAFLMADHIMSSGGVVIFIVLESACGLRKNGASNS